MISMQPTQEQATTGVIAGRDGAVYLVATASGRTFRAVSAETWIIGTPVTVLAGMILGRSGRPKPSTVYEV
jgi:hypothetical protein